ncbi:transmembrane protein 209 isoform X1 [Anopheles gambiae]|uniref:transmembrane protein 209 isoform X1 n=1 Tax=Anopheles coluzzii TaxID=1518534 RepID=UPI0020FF87A6|nr:transmembrane protein 209 isoform X1 [Anopheles coluzzii]XP_308809.5 transmembrane protein 209 isoform X1 [Anopheles gambiae]
MSSNPGSPVQCSPIVNRTLELNLNRKRSKECLRWGTVHILLLSVVLFDICNKCSYSFSNLYYVEYVAAAMLSCSMVYYYTCYFYYLFSAEPIRGTEQQRRILRFDANDSSFITTPLQAKQSASADNTPMNVSTSLLRSFHESSFSIASPRWVFSRGSPPMEPPRPPMLYDRNLSYEASPNVSGGSIKFSPALRKLGPPGDTILDDKFMETYGNHKFNLSYSEASMDKSNRSQKEQANNTDDSMNSSFGRYRFNDMSHLLKTSLYQLSSSVTPSKQLTKELETGPYNAFIDGSPEGLKKVSTTQLSTYVGNLRMWISLTILQRIEEEINIADQAFKSRGFADIQIGNIGLERLKKTAENQQLVSLYIPRLPLLIPFLEMSTNQEYLVQRIKDLAKGSCLADYRWNSGSAYKGISWDEHLPTDSAIIFHLFCTYLDSQLRPLPQPGGRPFFNRYVVVGDKKTTKETLAEVNTKNKAKCAILYSNPLKPKFNFVSDDKIHSCAYDRNNLFYVIIQFLMYMKTHHECSLEGINLGRSGINILCCIED